MASAYFIFSVHKLNPNFAAMKVYSSNFHRRKVRV